MRVKFFYAKARQIKRNLLIKARYNILIVDNILKITDFGLAKYTEAITRNITFKGYGTKEYCAPEVWKNEKI